MKKFLALSLRCSIYHANKFMLKNLFFFYFSTDTYVVANLWVLKRTVLDGSFEHPKHMFKLLDKKIYFYSKKLKTFSFPNL